MRNHPDPIPISSDKDKGKGFYYSGKDKYRNPSLLPDRNDMHPPRHTSHAGNTRPHGLGGINIRDNAEQRMSQNDDSYRQRSGSRRGDGSKREGHEDSD